jgi:hypothetical protein
MHLQQTESDLLMYRGKNMLHMDEAVQKRMEKRGGKR